LPVLPGIDFHEVGTYDCGDGGMDFGKTGRPRLTAGGAVKGNERAAFVNRKTRNKTGLHAGCEYHPGRAAESLQRGGRCQLDY